MRRSPPPPFLYGQMVKDTANSKLSKFQQEKSREKCFCSNQRDQFKKGAQMAIRIKLQILLQTYLKTILSFHQQHHLQMHQLSWLPMSRFFNNFSLNVKFHFFPLFWHFKLFMQPGSCLTFRIKVIITLMSSVHKMVKHTLRIVQQLLQSF